MKKLSLLVALTAAFVLTSQMTSADQLPSSASDASTDDEVLPSYVDWNGLGQPNVDDKRKWGNNKARMWGKRDGDEKRGWGQKSSRVWGKRIMDMDQLARLLQDERIIPSEQAVELQDKRKWAKNKARMWGK